MLSNWWDWSKLADVLHRLYGYLSDVRAPIYIDSERNRYRLARHDLATRSVTIGHDQLTLEQAYNLALSALRVPVLLLCAEHRSKDGSVEYSSVIHGLTGYGRIIDANDEVLVEWDDENFENNQADSSRCKDELYALLCLCRICKDRFRLPWNAARARPPKTVIEEVLSDTAIRSTEGAELMP